MKKTTLLVAHFLARHARLWGALGLLAVMKFGPPPAQAAVTEAWVHRYNNVVSNSYDQAFSVVRDAAGDIIVTGNTDGGTHSEDMLTIKYSGATGSVLWQQRYNGPANFFDNALAVAVDASGNVVVTGSSHGTNFNADYYTAKYSAADGALLWENHYNGPANNHDQAQAVAVDGSGNVVVTGSSYNTNLTSDYYTAKYAAGDGALLWEKRYNGPANNTDIANAVAVDGSGNVVVTGYSYNTNFNLDYYTAKYSAANGALLWERRYNGPANNGDAPQAVAVDGSGNVVVTGSSQNGAPNYDHDYYTAKYAAADGALLWERRYNGPANNQDQAQAVAVDGSGNVIVTGSSAGASDFGGYPIYDYYTAKYAARDGALLWENRYNGPANKGDEARAVALDGSGNVVVTGRSEAAYYTAKYAAMDGALLWDVRYNGPANTDEAQAVVVDGSGNVVVTGFSYNGSHNDYRASDYYTAKYAAADGALLWEQRYNGPLNGEDNARAIAMDGSNVVVTGASYNGTNNDYYTAKYAVADGSLLWRQRYNGPANGEDRAQALAVDGGGNVIVTGYSNNGFDPFVFGESDYYTAKYAAADGVLLWEKRYNGPANSEDRAQALAVDDGGNVVVTGYSYNTNFTSDYYTAKYVATDGALLWENRYNGPANDNDVAQAVAVDGSGNVVVTGYSNNGLAPFGFGESDYYTAKYAAADGVLLWEQRYNGPANIDDRANAVTVDSGGNVVVTGVSDARFGCFCPVGGDYYTAKYASADGALLWEKRYNGPANGGDVAQAVAVDRGGNVLVTGVSYNAVDGEGSDWDGDYYTAKYAATDGALLWEKRSTNGSASAVVVDGSGNVVVTGNSGQWPIGDYYTAKYAAADGALVWEKHYNGPANGYDRPSSLALGPNGMVAVTGSSSGDYATVVYWEHLPPVSIAAVATGICLRFSSVPSPSQDVTYYIIERAPAPTGPWTTINTQIASVPGMLEYIDTDHPAGSAFYRTRRMNEPW